MKHRTDGFASSSRTYGGSFPSSIDSSKGRQCLNTRTDTLVDVVPSDPFRGIDAYRFSDQAIFFAREREVEDLVRQVIVYRGVLLYGESGSGKSSLVNAGLIPSMIDLGFAPERLRVQPRRGAEIVVERIAANDEGTVLLPSALAPDGDEARRLVLSTDELRSRVQAAADGGSRPMLVFDQFEELVTLFEEARSAERLQRGRESQSAVVDVLVELLTLEHLPVKIVLSFREDYLAKVKTLLRKRPELVDQSMHLAPPQTDALYEIIRGPFERFPDRFERELTPEFAGKLADAIASRGELGTVNLSELQVVCFRLWSADEPERLFQERGLQGIVEDSVFQAINGFPEDLRYAALSVLTQMVTGSGVRTVISADDIVERVREDEPIGETQIREALRRLEKDTRLVRRERRREIEVYEIMSEFLVPWISWLRERRLESVRASEAAQIRRWHEDLRRARGLEEAGTEEGLRDAVRIATSLLIQSRYADFEVANGAWAVLHRLAEPHQATSVRKAAGHGIAAARSMEDELTPYLSEVLPYPAGMEESRPVVFQQRSLAKMVGVFAVLTLQAAATVFVTYAVIAAVLDLAGWSVDVPPLLVPGIVLAVGWGSLYTLEAIDWGNEHLNGLSAPYRPYREGIGIWEQWSGWPTNFVLPWVLAYAGAAAASGVGVDSRYAFYAVLGVASLAALRSYREAVLLF